ncbi:MAG TPA: cytochrome c3 family protein [Thermoanaerobaculia bacterium]|nr:cytochrome c3 family protein [Thermoanaerobaculia bacterium]
MPQVFPEWVNRVPLYLLAAVAVLGGLVTLGVWYYASPEFTDVGYRPQQPVAFSHRLHAGELEISCLYCHTTVERAAVASVPPTQTCMNCHQLVGRDLESLEPVRASAASGRPIFWKRVHKVPEYAYFPHAPHVAAGVGCSSCHGDVAAMDRVMQVAPLSMGWCLDCHRDPTPHLRAEDEVTDTAWEPPSDQATVGARLLAERRLAPPEDCGACHR